MMNKFALTAAVAATVSLFGAVPALAQSDSVTVAYGDLNLSSAAGHEVLAQRVDASAKAVCARPDIRDVKAMSAFQDCKAAAIADANQQLATAGVTVAAN